MRKLIFLLIILLASKCFGQDSAGSTLTVKNFHLLKNYILVNGKAQRVDISGELGGGMWVTYHSIDRAEWRMTTDRGYRIYFSRVAFGKEEHFGNLLMEDGAVKTEFNYGMPFKNKKMLEDEKTNRKILLDEFAKLLDLINGN